MKLVFTKIKNGVASNSKTLMDFLDARVSLTEQSHILNGLARACSYEHNLKHSNFVFDAVEVSGYRLLGVSIRLSESESTVITFTI